MNPSNSLVFQEIGGLFPLSQRERAGVRENCSDQNSTSCYPINSRIFA
jgi:hypothetical protein